MAVKIVLTFTPQNESPISKKYDSANISELVAGNQISANNSSPEFGVIGQYGSVKIQDKDNFIKQCEEKGLLNNSVLIDIYYNNNLIGNYESSQIQYNSKDYKYSFTFLSYLSSLETKEITHGQEDPNIPDLNGYQFLEKLFNASGMNELIIKDSLKRRLTNLTIKYFLLRKKYLLAAMNEFCNLAMCCIIIKSNKMEVIEYV